METISGGCGGYGTAHYFRRTLWCEVVRLFGHAAGGVFEKTLILPYWKTLPNFITSFLLVCDRFYGAGVINNLSTRSYFCCSNFWLPASWDVCRKFLFLLSIPAHDEHVTKQVTVNNFEQTNTLLLPRPCYHMSGPRSWVKGVDFHRLWCTYESWFRHRILS